MSNPSQAVINTYWLTSFHNAWREFRVGLSSLNWQFFNWSLFNWTLSSDFLIFFFGIKSFFFVWKNPLLKKKKRDGFLESETSMTRTSKASKCLELSNFEGFVSHSYKYPDSCCNGELVQVLWNFFGLRSNCVPSHWFFGWVPNAFPHTDFFFCCVPSQAGFFCCLWLIYSSWQHQTQKQLATNAIYRLETH